MSKETKPKVNGLRTAVRYGELTKDQAVAKYKILVAQSGFSSPDFERWIARR